VSDDEVVVAGPPWPPETLDPARWRRFAAAAVAGLERAWRRGRLPQSLLVVGPVGMGREIAALAAACILTCPEKGGVDCGCGSCRRVRAGIHPDVAFVQPGSGSRVVKIEQIRGVIEQAPGRPYESARRVWVIDSADAGCLHAESANAFLKTLEEPPAHVSFVLVAASASAVLPTIRSRCQLLRLPGPVAVASGLAAALAPELGPLPAGSDVAALVAAATAALTRALAGDPDGLLTAAARLGDHGRGFEVAAAAALAATATAGDPDRAETLVQLATAVLRAERRAAALNLNAERQLQSCLLSWYEAGVASQ
jgi:hypothetical protein